MPTKVIHTHAGTWVNYNLHMEQSTSNFLATSNPNKNVALLWGIFVVWGGVVGFERASKKSTQRAAVSFPLALVSRLEQNLYFCVINCRSENKPQTQKLYKGNLVYEKQQQTTKYFPVVISIIFKIFEGGKRAKNGKARHTQKSKV